MAAFSSDVVKTTNKNHTFQFTNESIDADEYYWDFGDGTTSTDENPTHQYGERGVYQVCLTAISDKGPFQTTHQEVTLGEWVLYSAKVNTSSLKKSAYARYFSQFSAQCDTLVFNQFDSCTFGGQFTMASPSYSMASNSSNWIKYPHYHFPRSVSFFNSDGTWCTKVRIDFWKDGVENTSPRTDDEKLIAAFDGDHALFEYDAMPILENSYREILGNPGKISCTFDFGIEYIAPDTTL